MELPDTHLEALKAIAGGHPDADQINPDILAGLRRWGMVMPGTLELTGTGVRLVCVVGSARRREAWL